MLQVLDRQRWQLLYLRRLLEDGRNEAVCRTGHSCCGVLQVQQGDRNRPLRRLPLRNTACSIKEGGTDGARSTADELPAGAKLETEA